MAIQFDEIKRTLAENKVFDAWQYVCSLAETLQYMDTSYNLIQKVYDYRRDTLNHIEQEIISQAIEHKGVPSHLTQNHLNRTHLNIAGYELDDTIFLKKTALEFFHYARLSIELLAQVMNIALFGDDAFSVTERNLPTKVTSKLSDTNDFISLRDIIKTHLENEEIEYLLAFDNYIKHIKTILIKISNSLFLGSTDKFEITEFTYNETTFPNVDTLQKVSSVRSAVLSYIDEALTEINTQVPNCINNSNRFQQLKFKQIFKQTDVGSQLQYITYFLEIEKDISELPEEIKVMPLLISENNEVNSFVLDLDEIFITNNGLEETGIIGIATAKTAIGMNELYRTYKVKECKIIDYYNYINNFTSKYNKHHMNIHAVEGEIIILKE